MPEIPTNPSLAPGRSRISVSLAESKTLRLYQQGRRLLARADFEDISIARFAKAANTSVGAFYVRFADKDTFLDFLTLHTFRGARRSFDKSLLSIASQKEPAAAISDAIISQFAATEFAGIVRLAVKRGLSSTERRRAFDGYRTHLADQVVSLLPHDTKSKDKTDIEFAIQAAIGVLTDAIASTPRSEPLKLWDYLDTIFHMLAQPLRNLKLKKPETEAAAEQSGVSKI